MDDVKRKVLLDIFASPLTLLPVVGGATALLVSWAVGGNPALTMGGIAGVLGGVGMFASRMIFGLEKLTNQAYEYVLKKQQANQQAALQRLDQRLRKDRDPRTERLLAQLQTLYRELQRDIEQGKISVSAHEVLDGVDSVFTVCVDYLDRSFRLWETASRMTGAARNNVLQQREELIVEVARSCEHLEQTINHLNEVATKRNKSDLAQLRARVGRDHSRRPTSRRASRRLGIRRNLLRSTRVRMTPIRGTLPEPHGRAMCHCRRDCGKLL